MLSPCIHGAYEVELLLHIIILTQVLMYKISILEEKKKPCKWCHMPQDIYIYIEWWARSDARVARVRCLSRTVPVFRKPRALHAPKKYAHNKNECFFLEYNYF